jgi:Helix-turn-helix domain
MGRKKKKPPTQQEILPEHRLFDTGYLMRMLGLGPDPIYRMCNNGLIEHFKINGLIYFHQSGIDDFLNRCRVKCR